MEKISLEEFLEKARISRERWDASKCNWEDLLIIANDYEQRIPDLTDAAELISSGIRKFPGVHSVRWRIKDTFGLLKKIVRKRLEDDPKPKWLNINKDSYLDSVTDLIGIRALHLFKNDCIQIDDSIRDAWNLVEPVVIYIRKGDDVFEELVENGAESKVHDDGYRSIHYIIESSPGKLKLKAEIQVRTIFQEGWSEIDHQVKYPDYTDNEYVKVLLDLFNGFAGGADNMGSFIRDLTRELSISDEKISQANREREQALAERDQAIADIARNLDELESLRKQDAKSKAIIKKMKADMDRLSSDRNNGFVGKTVRDVFVSSGPKSIFDSFKSPVKPVIGRVFNDYTQYKKEHGE